MPGKCHRLNKICFLIVSLFLMSSPFHWVSAQSHGAGGVNFAIDIQPILAQRCYKCHGPTESEGGLQLNSRDRATVKLESGDHAITPGEIQASTIMERIRSTDEDQRMPPEGKPLTETQIAKIEQWIEQGADWAQHWAFQKPVRPEVPKTKDPSWVKNPIDAFVLARLEDNALTPAKPVNKVALIRRASYDLIGLPPTSEHVVEFLADKSDKALERVIDRLLDSPQYGEKWARHWLDLVRYAETNGYERDGRKDLIWKYRDYVIRSFNDDKPFNHFALEQLAGDEVPDPDADSITATGFYRLGLWDDEPADRELSRYDYLDDILRTTSESFLAMTVGCARCHDHKIDPISQKDYYSMLAFFSDVSPHGGGATNHVAIPKPNEKAAFEVKLANKKDREGKLALQIDQIEKAFLVELTKKHPELGLEPQASTLPDDGVLVPDSIKAGERWEYTFNKPTDNWFQIAFDDGKWLTGPGGFGAKGTPGAVVRTEWQTNEIWMRHDFRLGEIPPQLTLKIHHDEDTAVYLNGKQIASFSGYRTDYTTIDVSEIAADVLQTGRNTLAVHCKQTGGGQYIDVGLSTDRTATPTAVRIKKFGKEILGKDKLNLWQDLRQQLRTSVEEELELKTSFAMAVSDRGRNKTWILGRGNPTVKGDEVDVAYPLILDPPTPRLSPVTDATSGKRLALAQWIASDDNPMTARVMANRIWQHHFGRGLVRSTSDFGYQGTAPTHPELLNWLGAEFVARGWKVKQLHKLIMMSNTYQMSSQGNDVAIAKDPTNNLLWRFNMRRLTAEEIRDSILFVNGSLNLKMFGTSTFPPLPPEVLATSSTPGSVWGKSPTEEADRRSIYIHVKRSLRVPMLESFDAPDPDTSCSARVATTVPTQALGMLNSRFLNDQAAKFAERLETEAPGKTVEQVRFAIQLTTNRAPTEKEVESDVEFLRQLRQDEKLDMKQVMQNYCLLMLNTNEFFYLD